MRLFVASAIIAASVAAVPASAQTFQLGQANSGPVDVSSAYAPGYSSYTFDNLTSPFQGGGVETATVQNQYAAPAGATTPFFSVGPSTSSPATLLLSGVNQLSFYWGSIDTYNSITFLGLGTTFSGSVFGGSTDPVSRPSREVTFNFTPTQAAELTGIRLNSGTNAFELDNLIFGSAVPEPASWMLMILGFGGLGLMLRRRRLTMSTAIAARA